MYVCQSLLDLPVFLLLSLTTSTQPSCVELSCQTVLYQAWLMEQGLTRDAGRLHKVDRDTAGFTTPLNFILCAMHFQRIPIYI